MRDEGGVPILTYHSVSERPDWLPWSRNISVKPVTFQRHLQELQRLGCTVIRTTDLLAARQRGAQLPPRAVAIHLDDGYLDNWVAALPMLQKHKMPATIFVSTDFVEPGLMPRLSLRDVWNGTVANEDLIWEGYLNWAEIQTIDAGGLIDIQSHGKDHGRVVTGPAVVDRLTEKNWRRYAWIQWSGMQGNMSNWYRSTKPPVYPVGSAVYESGGALVAREWIDGKLESESAYETRVRQSLQQTRAVLSAKLNRAVTIFCWPENLATPSSRRLALSAGFSATTAGKGENRQEENPTVLSRVHVADRAIGFRWVWMEGLYLRAVVRLYQGVYYWYLLLFPLYRLRRWILPLTLWIRGRR